MNKFDRFVEDETVVAIGYGILVLIFTFLTTIQSPAQTIGYLAVKDSGRYFAVLKTTEIDSVATFVHRDVKKALSESNYFKYETESTYIYVERKRVVRKKEW